MKLKLIQLQLQCSSIVAVCVAQPGIKLFLETIVQHSSDSFRNYVWILFLT